MTRKNKRKAKHHDNNLLKNAQEDLHRMLFFFILHYVSINI